VRCGAPARSSTIPYMRRNAACAIILTLSCGSGLAQSQTQKKPTQQRASTDPVSMTCTQILAMPSADYIAKIIAIDDSNVDGQLRGIRRYGACYDARTDALAASLARSGKGTNKTARADFAAFESALKSFTAKALADVPPRPPASQKEAYANLYEKHFRYEFYEGYEAKSSKNAKAAAPAEKSPAPSPANKSSAPTATAAPAGTSPAAGTKSTPVAPTSAEERARSDADPVTQAKNRFGKILESLPDDQMHELHSAFGEVIGPHSMSATARLAVYRYAIFLLEPPSATPFTGPPF
jgi:hypothetical protein